MTGAATGVGTDTGEIGGVSSETLFISGWETADAKISPLESAIGLTGSVAVAFGSPKMSPSNDIIC